MNRIDLDVGYFKGTLPVYANAGTLEFSADGVAYREKISGNAWSWQWPDTRVWFEPPGAGSGRLSRFVLWGVIGLLFPSRLRRRVMITGSNAQATFELASRDPRPVIVAQRIVDTVPGAAGKISFQDRPL